MLRRRIVWSSADLIRDLLLGRYLPVEEFDPRGVCIRGAVIEDRLDLAMVRLRGRVAAPAVRVQ
jgi:hypothetical protein